MAEILIIDDSAQMRRILSSILQAAGHSTRAAADGAEGVKLFDEKRPALVITDIVMPEQEGIETIRILRKKSPKMPILAISGSRSVYLSAATKLGATASLEKPFEADDLLLLVEQLL